MSLPSIMKLVEIGLSTTNLWVLRGDGTKLRLGLRERQFFFDNVWGHCGLQEPFFPRDGVYRR